MVWSVVGEYCDIVHKILKLENFALSLRKA